MGGTETSGSTIYGDRLWERETRDDVEVSGTDSTLRDSRRERASQSSDGYGRMRPQRRLPEMCVDIVCGEVVGVAMWLATD